MATGTELRVLYILTTAGLILMGCTAIGGLQGQWAEKKTDLREYVVEFNNDGTLTYGTHGIEFEGTYQATDSGTIRVKIGALFAPWRDAAIDYRIESDTLALIVDGKIIRHIRTKVTCQ